MKQENAYLTKSVGNTYIYQMTIHFLFLKSGTSLDALDWEDDSKILIDSSRNSRNKALNCRLAIDLGTPN